MVMMTHVCPGHVIEESGTDELLFEPLMHRHLGFLTEWDVANDAVEPRVDMAAGEDEAVMAVELPGVEPKDLEVSFTRGHVRIAAQRQSLVDGSKMVTHLSECGPARFMRVLHLGDEYDGERAEAVFRNGILTVKVPRSEAFRERRIEVKGEGAS